MKRIFKMAAVAAVCLLALHVPGVAQDEKNKEKAEAKIGDHDEIVIKRKGDKDSKVTVEIKDGQVYINGKQANEYDDENISVYKRSMRGSWNGNDILITPDAPTSPFRGGYSYGGDGYSYNKKPSAFLGVTTEDEDGGGVRIEELTKGSAAEKAGLKEGDVITKIDEKTVSTPSELATTIRKYKPEDKVTVTIKREGKEQKISATLGKYKEMTSSYSFSMPKMMMDDNFSYDKMYGPRAVKILDGRPRIGIKAQDTEDGKGVKVLDVDDESPAEKAGVKEGDVITEFDGKAVNSAEELSSASRASRGKYSLKVKLKRDDKPQEIEIKIPRKLKTADL